jgi:hypothetical protein
MRLPATLSPQPAKRFSSFSSARGLLRLFPQPLHKSILMKALFAHGLRNEGIVRGQKSPGIEEV